MAVQNPHRIDLGKMVQRYRKRAELTARQLDDLTGWTTTQKTSRVESGKYTLSDRDVDTLTVALRLSGEEVAELRELAALSRKRKSPANVASHAVTFIEFEQVATRIDMWSGELVPGLAQGPGYAEGILACSGLDRLPERVAARIARKKVLTRSDPPAVRLLLGEAALCRPVGGVEALAEQLEHLLELRCYSNVDVRVFPFLLGADEALGSRFTVVDTPRSGKRVYIEGVRRATYVHKPEDVAEYQGIFDHLWGRVVASDDDGMESERILRERIQQLA